MHDLEEHAGLNRAVEFLPTDEELDARLENTGERLTRELSVLAAYVKIYLTPHWGRPTADDPLPGRRSAQLLPGSTGQALRHTWTRTRCVKEIICTRVANRLVNIGGITFAYASWRVQRR